MSARLRGRVGALLWGVLLAVLAGGLTPRDAAAQRTRVLLVVGLGGTEAYRETFHEQAMALRQALVERMGVAEEDVVYLGEDPSVAPDAMRGRSTREVLAAEVEALADRAAPDDRILVILLGHGTSRGDEASFNLPGPDVSGTELDGLLDAFSGQTVAVVDTSPSSGPFVQALSRPGRIVLTATKTGREGNETRFGRFFVEAVTDSAADLDKDGRISLLEAFRYARAEVARAYQQENLLQTEHAVLDDDGDGEGSEEPGEGASDGRLAGRFWIGDGTGKVRTGAGQATATVVPDSIQDPELRSLYEKKLDLERRIDDLRARRENLEQTEYEDRLEELLVELALTNRSIQAREGGGS